MNRNFKITLSALLIFLISLVASKNNGAMAAPAEDKLDPKRPVPPHYMVHALTMTCRLHESEFCVDIENNGNADMHFWDPTTGTGLHSYIFEFRSKKSKLTYRAFIGSDPATMNPSRGLVIPKGKTTTLTFKFQDLVFPKQTPGDEEMQCRVIYDPPAIERGSIMEKLAGEKRIAVQVFAGDWSDLSALGAIKRSEYY